jgi:hypothetical protein
MQRDRRRANRPRTQSYHAEPALTGKKPRARLEDTLEKKPAVLDALKKAVEPAPLPRVVSEPDLPPPPSTVAGGLLDPVPPPADGADPKTARRVAKKYSREEMHGRLLKAQGSHAITDAFEAFAYAGYTLEDDDQDAWLQLLEHRDEARVRLAIERLSVQCARKPPRHKPLLVQRLRRIEDNADEPSTREAADALRRAL